MFCDGVFSILYSLASNLLRKRRVAGCFTVFVCWMSVLCLFLTVPWVGLQSVIACWLGTQSSFPFTLIIDMFTTAELFAALVVRLILFREGSSCSPWLSCMFCLASCYILFRVCG